MTDAECGQCETAERRALETPPSGWIAFSRYWLPVLVFTSVIFVLSSGPAPAIASIFTNEDKLLHFGEYGTFGLLLARAMMGTATSRHLRRAAVLAMTMGFLTGCTDELYQSSVPGRSSSLADLATDCAAVILAGTAMYFLRRTRSAARRR